MRRLRTIKETHVFVKETQRRVSNIVCREQQTPTSISGQRNNFGHHHDYQESGWVDSIKYQVDDAIKTCVKNNVKRSGRRRRSEESSGTRERETCS